MRNSLSGRKVKSRREQRFERERKQIARESEVVKNIDTTKRIAVSSTRERVFSYIFIGGLFILIVFFILGFTVLGGYRVRYSIKKCI